MPYTFKKEIVYSIDEVSKKLEVDVGKLKEHCSNGYITARKIGDKYFVTGENLFSYFHYTSKR